MNRYTLALENEVYAETGEDHQTPDNWSVVAFESARFSKRIRSFGSNYRAAEAYLYEISDIVKHREKNYDVHYVKNKINKEIEQLPDRF